jgi:hypothetical protein
MMIGHSGTRTFHLASAKAGAPWGMSLLTVLLLGSFSITPAFAQAQDDFTSTPPLPIQALNADPSIELGLAPGVFSWRFDAAGWPNGLSSLGQDPNHVTLNWDGKTMDDLITGRPRYDMVPLAMLASQTWDEFGQVLMKSEKLDSLYPQTRVRYESAGDGLQAVHALHVQNRYRATSDSTGYRLQTVFGYAGAGAKGEYDGSALRRGRQITARIALEGNDWGLWIQDVASRRAVGAHAGVLPFPGASYESIYQRLGATVSDPTARRRTVRNDLELGGRMSHRGWLTSLRAIRSSQTLDFKGSSLENRAWTTRWQVRADAGRSFRPGRIILTSHIERDGGYGGSAWKSRPETRTRAQLGVTLSSHAGYQVAVGAEEGTVASWWYAQASADRNVGPVRVDGSLSRRARHISMLEWSGFSEEVASLSSLSKLPLQEQRLARLELQVPVGPLTWGVEASYLQEHDAIVHQLASDVTLLSSSVLAGTRSLSVVTISLLWREDHARGVYANLHGSMHSSKAPASTAVGRLWQTSMPDQWATARLGMRALLFEGDLDLDLYVRGRVWQTMNGLRLHTPTGLLVLPSDESSLVPESAAVDIGATGMVRGATFFFSYENMFSGTTLLVGNLLVPDYPLPRQRIRFGVYWPIAN